MDEPTEANGPGRLTALKQQTGLTDEVLGAFVGASGAAFLNWRTAAKSPVYAYRVALQILTSEVDARGQVTKPGIPLDAWDESGAEAEIISRAKPLAQAMAGRLSA